MIVHLGKAGVCDDLVAPGNDHANLLSAFRLLFPRKIWGKDWSFVFWFLLGFVFALALFSLLPWVRRPSGTDPTSFFKYRSNLIALGNLDCLVICFHYIVFSRYGLVKVDPNIRIRSCVHVASAFGVRLTVSPPQTSWHYVRSVSRPCSIYVLVLMSRSFPIDSTCTCVWSESVWLNKKALGYWLTDACLFFERNNYRVLRSFLQACYSADRQSSFCVFDNVRCSNCGSSESSCSLLCEFFAAA